jgi:hypothetical protein
LITTRLHRSSGVRGWATEIAIASSGWPPRACSVRGSEVADRSTGDFRGR